MAVEAHRWLRSRLVPLGPPADRLLPNEQLGTASSRQRRLPIARRGRPAWGCGGDGPAGHAGTGHRARSVAGRHMGADHVRGGRIRRQSDGLRLPRGGRDRLGRIRHSPRGPDRGAGSSGPGSERRLRTNPITIVTLAAFGIVAIAWSATSVAGISHQAIRVAAAEGFLEEAAAQAKIAGELDPGMALYARALGAARLLQGEAVLAVGPLTRATELNPSDDLAWRTLALAHEAAGDAASAQTALDRALEVQRSDPTNLLLLARLQLESGRDTDAVVTLAEVVQAWPEIVAAPGWSDQLPPGTTTPEVVELALERWSGGRPSPEPPLTQQITLAAMAGRDDLAARWAEERLGPSLGPMFVAVMACQQDAPSLLQQATGDVRRSSLYWQLVARQAALEGRTDTKAARLLEIMVAWCPAPGPHGAHVQPIGGDRRWIQCRSLGLPANSD